MKKSLKLLIILLLSVMIGGSATMVKAQPEALDFITYGPSGAFSLPSDGAGTFLFGQGIIIDVVKGTNTPSHAGVVLPLTNTLMDIKAHAGYVAGDYIKIYSNTETYLDGVVLNAFWTSAIRFNVVYGDIEDTKPASIVMDYFGLTDPKYYEPNAWIGFMNLTFDYDGLRFLNGSVYNEFSGSGAPIPGSVLLLGTGILGLVGIGIRKRSA